MNRIFIIVTVYSFLTPNASFCKAFRDYCELLQDNKSLHIRACFIKLAFIILIVNLNYINFAKMM